MIKIRGICQNCTGCNIYTRSRIVSCLSACDGPTGKRACKAVLIQMWTRRNSVTLIITRKHCQSWNHAHLSYSLPLQYLHHVKMFKLYEALKRLWTAFKTLWHWVFFPLTTDSRIQNIMSFHINLQGGIFIAFTILPFWDTKSRLKPWRGITLLFKSYSVLSCIVMF